MSPARLQVSNAPAGIRVRMPVTSRDDVPHRVIYYNTKNDLSTIIFHYVNPALFILTNRLSFVSALLVSSLRSGQPGHALSRFIPDVPYLYTRIPVCRIIQQTDILYSNLRNRAEQIIRRTECGFIRPRQCLHTRGKA